MPALHRIQEVRRRQGLTLQVVAKDLGTTARVVETLEKGDIRLSDLYRIAVALGVPAEELLAGKDCDEVTQLRGLVVRAGRIAVSLVEQAPNPTIKNLAQALRDLIVEVMPELHDQRKFLEGGRKRGWDDIGRIAETPINMDYWAGDGPEAALPSV